MKRTSCQRKESLTREWHEASDIYAKAVANGPWQANDTGAWKNRMRG